LKQAVKICQESHDLLKTLLDSEPDVVFLREALAMVTQNLGMMRTELGDVSGSLECYDRAEVLYVKLKKEAPKDPDYAYGLALINVNRGTLRMDVGETSVALQHLEKGRDGFLELLKHYRLDVDYRAKLAMAYLNLGTILASQKGKQAQAGKNFELAREL